MLLFAVTVDDPAGTSTIRNSVTITDAEGDSADSAAAATVPAPAPLLSGWAVAAAVGVLSLLAAWRIRRSPRTRP